MKKNNFFVLVPVVVGTLFFSGAVLAAANPGLRSATAGIGAKNFCTNFSALAQKYQDNLNKEAANVESRLAARAQKEQTNRQDVDNTLAQNRAKWTQNRQAVYAKLSGRAATDVEKQAVAVFQSTIEAAVTAREGAVDGAKAAFRQGLNQLIVQHQSAAQQTLTGFQSAVQAAVTAAANACSAGTVPATVRTTWQAALAAARAARKTNTGQVDAIGAQVKQLAQTRTAAVKQAMQTYQTALQTAVNALKAAFAKPVSASTTAPATP